MAVCAAGLPEEEFSLQLSDPRAPGGRGLDSRPQCHARQQVAAGAALMIFKVQSFVKLVLVYGLFFFSFAKAHWHCSGMVNAGEIPK